MEANMHTFHPEASVLLGGHSPKTHRSLCGQHLETLGSIVEPGSAGTTWIPAGHLNSSIDAWVTGRQRIQGLGGIQPKRVENHGTPLPPGVQD